MKDRRNTPWTTVKMIPLYDDQTERILDLLNDYRDGIVSGAISGYGQSKADELYDVDTLIKKFKI